MRPATRRGVRGENDLAADHREWLDRALTARIPTPFRSVRPTRIESHAWQYRRKLAEKLVLTMFCARSLSELDVQPDGMRSFLVRRGDRILEEAGTNEFGEWIAA